MSWSYTVGSVLSLILYFKDLALTIDYPFSDTSAKLSLIIKTLEWT